MSGNEISELCRQLENSYPDGDYVSRATLFNRALAEGKITEETRDAARLYYRNLWTYTWG